MVNFQIRNMETCEEKAGSFIFCRITLSLFQETLLPETKYSRLPRAGDTEHKFGSVFTYLSPLPVPTGIPAFSARNLHRGVNETYLDFSVGRGNFEFMARAGIGSIAFITLFFLFVSGFGSWLRRDVQPFLAGWFDFFTNAFTQGFIWTLSAVYLCIFIYTVRKVSTYPPIRFNRQRREVAFLAKRGDRPRYIQWEDIIICVSSGQLITQYTVMPDHKLIIGLRDTLTGDVLWTVISTGSLNLAISEWEAIRAYMEEGPSVLPPQQTDELEEGSVAFFHLCRRTYRKEHSYLRYLWGFVTIQFFSGWTLPCYISGWVNKRPKAGFPKEVLDWSRPLPSNQHAKPSEELLQESAEVLKAFSNRQSLLDYFKIKHSNSGHCE
ncbi:DUF6708 domain-containing protein [Pseudomonas fluorescens]|uniref:DUF6708 domain-containing protein n=1 Tax=Pseudomonas fluorescens TaxID=294 RepID=UPI00259BC882|nr:DUF6708 domain-containing protein [Pseudomonas fluorescens]WJK12466.1 hypothetical protein QR290_06625 [Pseudomonas fluorescens]